MSIIYTAYWLQQLCSVNKQNLYVKGEVKVMKSPSQLQAYLC